MGQGPSGAFAGIMTERAYNKRLQPMLEYALVTGSAPPYQNLYQRCYDFHMKGGISATLGITCTFPDASGDNGNVYQIVNKLDGNRTQNFTYDAFNRISSAYTSGVNWGETYTTDAWGNLTNRGPVTGKTNYELLNAAPANVKNQLSGLCHDTAGNVLLVTGNCPTGTFTPAYTYDAENRLVSTAGVTYTYDGDGKRVKKSTGTLYWTGMGSDALDESDLSGNINEEYFYFNGMRVARLDRPSNTAHYYVADHLGTARIIATPSSYNAATVAESDYYPYGGEIPISGSDSNHYKFTGKERDAESGLDNFGARYDAGALGRFMTPDPENAGADPGDPQSWNGYSYVSNNPLNSVDPDGLARCAMYIQIFTWKDGWHGSGVTGYFCDDAQERIQQVTQVVKDWITAPRDPVCMAKATAAGVGIGAGTGGVLGAIGGGVGGGVVGTAVGPGGTLAGIGGGGTLGAGYGAAGGGAIGGLAGGGMGFVACKTGGDGSGGRGSGSNARLTKPQQRQTAKYLGMKEVKGLSSQGQLVFEKNGRYFSFSNTSHTAGEVFKELDRNGNRIATTDLDFNRIGP